MSYKKLDNEFEASESEDRWNETEQPEDEQQLLNEGEIISNAEPKEESSPQQLDVKDPQLLYPDQRRGSRVSSFSAQSSREGRGSVLLPQLQVTEKKFFELVESGDVEAVKEFLQESSMFNINCTNYQGMSALHTAMENHNEEMVYFLLQQKKLEVGDCALHAIRLDQPKILVNILDRLRDIDPELEYQGCFHSPDFSVNMTPLITAAQYGNYDIIGILMDRGHTIPKPHKPCCLCPEECLRVLKTEDILQMIMAILDVYEALASPAYIFHVSSDPILYAFELSEELLDYSKVHSIFKKSFLQIADDVKMFAADLVGCCRSCEEVKTILNQSEGSRLRRGNFMFPRLILAMNLKQKEFVANASVQQVLEIACIKDWHEWKCYNLAIKVFYVFPRIIQLPYIIAICLFTPRSKKAEFYSLPINRMISHSASYIIFLFLLFLQSNQDKTDQRKKMEFSGLEIPIAVFVVGHIWKDFRLCILQGARQFFRFRWNIFKIILDVIFAMYYVFFIGAYIQVLAISAEEQQLERKYWHYLDPQLIAEVLFAIATIMSYFQLLLTIQVQENIGPLQVSLGKMLIDCIKYAILFSIIIMGFSIGLSRLYSYYKGMSQVDPDTKLIVRQESPFTDPLDTLKFLFWGLFSVSDPDNANVVIENIPGEDGNSIINEHYITEALGYYAFAVYMVLTVIIVLNMMIGTMADTFNKVISNADVEWVFGRTEVYLAYTQQSVLPSPFNLIPNKAGHRSWKECCRKGLCGKFFRTGSKDVEKADSDDIIDDDYPKLMTLLVQRYFSQKYKLNKEVRNERRGSVISYTKE